MNKNEIIVLATIITVSLILTIYLTSFHDWRTSSQKRVDEYNKQMIELDKKRQYQFQVGDLIGNKTGVKEKITSIIEGKVIEIDRTMNNVVLESGTMFYVNDVSNIKLGSAVTIKTIERIPECDVLGVTNHNNSSEIIYFDSPISTKILSGKQIREQIEKKSTKEFMFSDSYEQFLKMKNKYCHDLPSYKIIELEGNEK